jgi:cysteinyl-tRNA synthetase
MQISPEQIEKLVLERSEARKARNFKRSDEIRDYLLTIDVVLLDGPQGTTWEIK